jgi:hypothetical protein
MGVNHIDFTAPAELLKTADRPKVVGRLPWKHFHGTNDILKFLGWASDFL